MSDENDAEENIISLESEKERRKIAAMMKELENAKGFDIDLNIAFKTVHFDGMGGSHDDAAKDHITITVSEITGERCPCIAGIHLNRVQWEEMRKLGDGLFDSLQRAMVEVRGRKSD